MDGAVFPSCCLAWGRLLTRPPLETPGHSQSCPGQSLLGTLLFSLGSWCTQGFVCIFQESVSPVLWKFCNPIPLASKAKFPGDSQSLSQIPRLVNLLWVLEASKQCENFFGIMVLQCVVPLLGGSMMGLITTSSKVAYMPHAGWPRSAATMYSTMCSTTCKTANSMTSEKSIHAAGHSKPVLWDNTEG